VAAVGLALPAARAEEPPADASRRYARIHVIDFEGEIEPALAAYAVRRIDAAEREKADLVVFRIDSPGGRVDSSEEVSERIQSLPKTVRSLAWVKKAAWSGAAMVAIACDEIAMGTKSYLGDAQPIYITPEGIEPVGEKAESPLRAVFRSYATDNGYPPLLAEKMVSKDLEVVLAETEEGRRIFVSAEDWREAEAYDRIEGVEKSSLRRVRAFPKGQLVSLTASEAKEYGFASRVVPDEDALLAALSAPDAQVVQHRMSASEKAARWLLGVSGVLSAILLFTVVLTLWQGIGTHTVVGGVALVLLVLVIGTADLADGFPILLLAVGVLLLAAEAFLVPGFGLPGILGVLSFVTALLFLTTGFTPGRGVPFDAEAAKTFGLQLVVTLLVGGVTLVALARFFPSAPYARRLLLLTGSLPTGAAVPAPVGTTSGDAVAVTPLRPAGRARLSGEADLVDVVTEGDFVEAGTPLRVVRVEGNRVVVRPTSPGRTA
jgi:membrane-bound serine protease (ClpP class)